MAYQKQEANVSTDGECPLGGDIANDCADCIYAGEYHFVDGACVKRPDSN